MTKIQNKGVLLHFWFYKVWPHRLENLNIRIWDLFRISCFEFIVHPTEDAYKQWSDVAEAELPDLLKEG